MNKKPFLLISFVLLIMLGSSVWAGGAVVLHDGAADPLTEGWSAWRQDNNFSVGPVTGEVTASGTYDAWQIADEGGNDGAGYSYDISALADDALANGFIFSVELNVIGNAENETVIAGVNFNENRFDLNFTQSDGILTVDLFGGESYTLPDTAGDYHLFELVYNSISETADLFVDGVEQISDHVAPDAGFHNGEVVIGSSAGGGAGTGNYSLVQLEIVSSVKINFQEEILGVPEGYLADWGQVYDDRGNGFSYGWDIDVSGGTRQREGDLTSVTIH